MKESPVIRVRRLALGAMLTEGGLPEPWQFERAGLPPLFRASDLLRAQERHAAAVLAADQEARKAGSQGSR